MPDINFSRIASDVIAPATNFIESRRCPDQFLGPLNQILGSSVFPKRLPVDMRVSSPCVIMVLESPHIKEFIDAPGPAKGYTGEMIRAHLRQALPISNHAEYSLIVVNAIQYQCSLGVSTDLYRDRVFRSVWSKGGSESLRNRVKQLYRHGDIIMNCCTKGQDYETETPLRLLVEKELRTALPGVRSIRRLHPSVWSKPMLVSTQWSTGALENNDAQSKTKFLLELSKASDAAFKKTSNNLLESASNKLVDVREGEIVNGSLCTVLVFSDGSTQHMSVATFDPQGLITSKARGLLGKSVRTTCWNPKSDPERWSRLGYFSDVFPL